MPSFKSIFSGLVGLLTLVAICLGLYFGIRGIWRALVSVDSQLAVAVVAAGATLLASTITVMLGRHFERKKEIDAHFRGDKIKIYDAFLVEFFKAFDSSETQDSEKMVKFLRGWQQKLVLWGGSNVLSTYFTWTNHLKTTAPNAKTILLMDEFFRALRADIGQSSRGIAKGAFCNLILRHGDFFLQQAKLNPDITLSELEILEKEKFGDAT